MNGLATGGEIVELGQALANRLDHAGGRGGQLSGRGRQGRVGGGGRTGPQHEELVGNRHHAAGLPDVRHDLGRKRSVRLGLPLHLRNAVVEGLDEVRNRLCRVLRVSDAVDELDGEQ